MKHIQKISSITVLTLLLSIFVSITSAFADDTSIQSTTGSTTVTSSTYDGNLGQIDALYNQLLTLRQQEKDLDLQMKVQRDLNISAIKALYAQVSTSDLAQIKTVHDQNKSLHDTNKSLYDQWISLHKQLKGARAAKDEKQSTEILLEINVLKKQLQPIQDQMKANNASIKDVEARVNATRKQIYSVLNPLKSIEIQMRTLWITERSFEAQRNTGWKAFNDSVNNGDMNGAALALNQVVTAKQQILSTKNQIYSLEQQMGTALNVSSSTTTTTAAASK
jgi:hypothetical protein